MIAIDASALLAVVFLEPEASDFLRILTEYDCIVGAPTRFESKLNLRLKATPAHLDELLRILRLPNVETVDFTEVHANIAQAAFDRYGRRQDHPARLNFGDCMAYAIAKAADAPLLFKGGDFLHTDVRPAITV